MNNFWYHTYKKLPSWFWTQFQEGGWDNFSGWQIVLILKNKPELYIFFDWEKISYALKETICRFKPELRNLLLKQTV